MPQMAPLYWELLFFMFILSMITVGIIIYHSPKISSETELTKKQVTNQINWKW
uniref:ATP synthase complex subunit 8 n=1 Tax=Hotea curculionoides TaxID=1603600 RepID=A0A2P1CLS7_9HEMI|nr:ATP synthase F0 subunit 8 [Hotea curculionoides]